MTTAEDPIWRGSSRCPYCDFVVYVECGDEDTVGLAVTAAARVHLERIHPGSNLTMTELPGAAMIPDGAREIATPVTEEETEGRPRLVN